MRKHPQLYGLLMYPSSLSQREHKKTIFSGECAVKNNFKDNYQKRMAEIQIIAESAKIFILNNYKKVRNWSDMEISVVDNSKKETFYYKYKSRKSRFENIRSKSYEKILTKIDARRKKWHNPVKKVSDIVLDTIDGAFSVKINGKCHNWIDKESAIILADYIEKNIKKKDEKKIQ